VEFVVDDEALGRIFSDYFGFLCQAFHQCFTLIIHHHPELVQ
jgi:hypothetical protein